MAGFGDYWLRLVKRNKDLENGETRMTITVTNFRNALEQAYNEGAKAQAAEPALFDKIFGKLGAHRTFDQHTNKR